MLKTKTRWLAGLAVLAVLLALPKVIDAFRERPKLTPEMQREAATHIVTGTAKRVYATAEKDGNWRVTHFVAELNVETTEKGEALPTDKPLYVRWFSRSWSGGNPPADSSGHYGWQPKAGDRMRAFLSEKSGTEYSYYTLDGGLNALIPNGFEEL